MKFLRSLIAGFAIAAITSGAAIAQCGTTAPANRFCGNSSGAPGLSTWTTVAPSALTPIAAGTILGNPTGSLAAPIATRTPVLGVPGANTGTLALAGATSGTATITPQAAAGSPTLTLPNTTGTFLVNASAPLSADPVTGAVSITGAAGGVLAGSGPTFTPTPTLGVPGSSQGSVGFAGLTSGTAILRALAIAGSPTLLLPNTSGTLVSNAVAPLAIDANTGAISCTALGSCGTTVTTIASLKALAVPAANTTIYVQGYTAPGDGGGGWFFYNSSDATTDNGCTVIIPNSAPGTGRWNRNYSSTNGSVINVKWCGVKGDGTTENIANINAAVTLAVAIKGGLYFPGVSATYLLNASIVIPDSTTHGLRIFGDSYGTPVGAGGSGTTIATTAATVFDMTGVALGGTGSISNVTIENLQLVATGASGKALKVWNVDAFRLNNVVLDATQGTALDMAGTANFSGSNIFAYSTGGPPIRFSQDAVGSQSNGPGSFDTVHCSITNGAYPCASLSGDFLGVSLRNFYTTWVNSTASAAITVDGPSAGTPVGVLVLDNIHAESTYNTTNTGATVLIGNTNKAGSVVLTGGNMWGQGNGTNYQQDGVRVVAARNVSWRDGIGSKIGSVNGFSRGLVRLEATFPGGSDTYRFEGLKADVSGSMYSDANGRCTGTADCIFDTVKINTLALGNALSPLNGGTGASLTLTIGDLLQASSSTQLARLAAVATGNVLLSGGVGTASAWGKVGLTTHVSGILPIANGGFDSTAWTAYTPTVTSQTGTCDATCQSNLTLSQIFYKQEGKFVFVRGKLSIGASLGAGTPAGGLVMTLAPSLNAKDDGASLAASYSSGAAMSGLVGFAGLSTVSFYLSGGTTPWATTASIRFSGVYETP